MAWLVVMELTQAHTTRVTALKKRNPKAIFVMIRSTTPLTKASKAKTDVGRRVAIHSK